MVPTSAPHWLAWDGPCHWREACKGSGAGGVPKNRPQCNCSWTLGTLSRPPCPLFRRENFLDAHHATVHRAILAPRGGPRKILRRHSRQAGTRWECSRVLGALPRSPATPQVSPRWWKGLPCASHPAHAVPRCPLLYTAETTSEEPVFGGRECRIPEDSAAGLMELALGLGKIGRASCRERVSSPV